MATKTTTKTPKPLQADQRAVLVTRACEAYMFERWEAFARLSNRLDAIGKRELSRALYVP